jgi:hypothetical protein
VISLLVLQIHRLQPPQIVTQNALLSTYTVNAAGAADETPTAEGMNPPHGQQNHRCDIAVGAPLDSK